MTKDQFTITGMHCAGCAQNLTKAIQKVPGVIHAQVNYSTDKAHIEYQKNEIDWNKLKDAVASIGNYKIILNKTGSQKSNEQKDINAQKIKDLKNKTIISLSLFIIILAGTYLKFLSHEIIFVLTSVVLFYSGRDFFTNAWLGLKNKSANMDTLIALGTGTAYLYSTVVTFWPAIFNNNQPVYYETATAIIGLILLGRYLESVAKGKASEAIQKLLNLQAKKATVLVNKKLRIKNNEYKSNKKYEEVEIELDQLNIGNVLVVKPGEKIPVDGIILEGESWIDESLITGESKPVKKKPGDKLIGSTINNRGRLIIYATQIGEGTILAQIIKLVETAQESQAPIQKLADKISGIFVPIVISIAILAFVIWYLIIGIPFTSALVVFITVLIISCPCALGLATPISVMVGTGKGAENGILIKNAEKLQIAGNIKAIVFDKTGTLTKGLFDVTDIVSADINPVWNKKDLLQIAASVEQSSEHPIGTALVNKADKEKIKLKKTTKFEAIEGKGVKAEINKQSILIGTRSLMEENQITRCSVLDAKVDKLTKEAKTISYIAINGKTVGGIAFADQPKRAAKNTIRALQKAQIDVWMITGDNPQTAKGIGRQLGIHNIMADVLPHQKVNKVKELQNKYQVVAMVGDGVNDAPALAQANVGISMATGTDVAIEAADITLIRGKIELVERAIVLSRQTMTNIKQNLFWAFGYNAILIPVAAGVLTPWGVGITPIFASAAMAFSSLSVVLNALRLKTIKLQ